MRVLVTGATSLLGRLTAVDLAARGDTVTVFQRGAAGLEVDEVRGDVGSIDDVRRAVAGQDAVVHIAAKVGVVGPWSEFERVNVTGTSALLDASRDAGVNRFVYISSPSVAHSGSPLMGAAAEPANPASTRGHYATSKAIAETNSLQASGADMRVVALRPHLIWGPGDTQLVGRIVDRARAGRLALVGSGNALVDSTYITNAVDATIAALDTAQDLGGKVFVVSNAQPRTVGELLGRIVDAAGLNPPNRHVPTPIAFTGGLAAERFWQRTSRTDDPPMTSFLAEQLSTAHWFDQTETQKALNWVPAVGLDEGFERLRKWFDR